MKTHKLDHFEYDKPEVCSVCTCGWESRRYTSKDRAEKMHASHAEAAVRNEAKLDEWVQRQVDAAPPLSDEQRMNLRSILKAVGDSR